MHIQWYPGHMTKAMRMMSEEMKVVDSVIYVLDSRAVMSSVNPSFDELIGKKPTLYVLNKADLAPLSEVEKWKRYFLSNNKKCITANSCQKGNSNIIISALKEINAEKIERYSQKGVAKTIRAMVIGIPNCGKSTLINSLIAKKRTVTGDKPGVTKGKQWVSIDTYIDLLDTPGTLYPDFADQNKAVNLALIGSIREEILDIIELAKEMVAFLAKNYPDRLKEKYGLAAISEDYYENLNAIAKRRGYIVRGGEYDLERTASAVIQDFRKQAFGKIILEKTND
ncbi:ribosome biogenesis GTPase YlqF [bacterium]|nr:ribosome biogenesis GTPase YlqF [bacterium]